MRRAHRLAYVGVDAEPRDGAVAHADVEQLAARGAVHLGAMQRDGGVSENVFRILVPRAAHGDAGARRDEDVLSLDVERLLERFAQPLRHAHGVARVVDIVEQHVNSSPPSRASVNPCPLRITASVALRQV